MEDREIPKHNQSEYLQQRLNNIMSNITKLWANPITFDRELLDYNYKIIFQDLRSYYSEIKTEDNKDLDKLSEELDNLIRTTSIVISKQQITGYHRMGQKKIFNTEAWNIINKKLRTYQDKILAESKKIMERNNNREGRGV